MGFLFQSGDEYVMLVINRQEKYIKLGSSKTNYQFEKLPWRYLFDKGEEEEQDKITEKLNDHEFEATIIAAFASKGYSLVKKVGAGDVS